jgi:mannosyltransferase
VSPASAGDASHRLPALAVPVLLCVALLALRVPVAATPAMWIDEAFSLHHAQRSIGHLWAEGWRLESSPPLYYSVLWAWVRVFGDGEFGARLLSLVLYAGTAAFVYGAARTLGGRAAGAVAAPLSLMPALIFEYSIEIRPYALQHLFIAAAFFAWARVLVEVRHGRLHGPQAVARALAPVVLAATASFYTHTTSFAFIAGLAGSAALYGLATRGLATRAGRSHAIAWAAACAVTAVACLPQALAALGVAQSNRAGLAWMPPTFDLVLQSRLWRSFALGHATWNFMLSIPAALAVFGAFALAAWRMRSRPEVLAIGVGVPLIGVTMMLIAGVMQSVLLPRTVSWLWLPLAILVGCAAAGLDRRAVWPRVAALGFAALFAATSFEYVREREAQRPWVGVLAELGDRIGAGERIVMLDPEVGCLLTRYASGRLRDAPRGRLELGEAQQFRSGQRLDIGCNRLPELGPESLAPPASTWVLTGDSLQRSDLDRVLARGVCGASVSGTIVRLGLVFATRIAPSAPSGASSDCAIPADSAASHATHPGARP